MTTSASVVLFIAESVMQSSAKKKNCWLMEQVQRMSTPNKEYLIAKATLCRDLAVNQILAGEGEQASRNLMRMMKALNEVGIINEREGENNE